MIYHSLLHGGAYNRGDVLRIRAITEKSWRSSSFSNAQGTGLGTAKYDIVD